MRLKFEGKNEPQKLKFWLLTWRCFCHMELESLEKKWNKDDDEDEEPGMKKWRGRRSRSTRSENLFGECRSDEEESRAEGKKNRRRRNNTDIGKINSGIRVLKTRVSRGFFFHISCHYLQLKFLKLDFYIGTRVLETRDARRPFGNVVCIFLKYMWIKKCMKILALLNCFVN